MGTINTKIFYVKEGGREGRTRSLPDVASFEGGGSGQWSNECELLSESRINKEVDFPVELQEGI